MNSDIILSLYHRQNSCLIMRDMYDRRDTPD